MKEGKTASVNGQIDFIDKSNMYLLQVAANNLKGKGRISLQQVPC